MRPCGDIADAATLTASAREADAVVYAGAAPAEATQLALAALIAALSDSRKPLVYISGSSRYGDTGGRGPANESVFAALLATAPSGREPERIVYTAAERGLRGIVVVGAGILHGRGGGATPTFWLADARKRGAAWYIGDGAQRWSAGHVDDLGALVARTIERGDSGGVYNAVTEAISLREAATGIADCVGIADGAVGVSQAEAARAWGASWSGMLGAILWLSSERAQRELGRRPTAPRFSDDLAHGQY